MADSRKKIPAVFYASTSGNEPVREWLKKLPAVDRKAIGVELMTVEYGWPIGMPTCRPMGAGLHEVRTDISGGRISRVLFCVKGNKLILLHGFIKKAQKIPKHDLQLGKDRQKEVLK